MDDVLQEVRMKLWMAYKAEQARMDSATNGLWVCKAKWAARNARKRLIYKGRSHKRMQPNGKYTLEKFVVSMTDPERITSDHFDHDSKQVRQADKRTLLEDLLTRLFDRLEPQQHERARLLLAGLARGETLNAIVREQDWNEETTRYFWRKLKSLMLAEDE